MKEPLKEESLSEELSKEYLLAELRHWFSDCGNKQAYEQIRKLIEEKPKVTEEFVVKWAIEMAFRPNKKGYKERVRDMLKELGVEVEK